MTAQKLYGDIVFAVRTLDTFPLRNALLENEPWRSRGLRKLPVKNYLVFYTVDEEKKNIHITRIMYGGMDIDKRLNEH
ncbi:MAG: type II toxin-antitoxin system RelE/ParE family toxin [Clostridia bacterium]|nr:type II toxin-antitoxin system RelE/ParE family toxin [Clostridia bacterium]